MLFVLLAACQSHITGNEGNFEFAYWTDDDVVDFNKPIAVGAKLDITVSDVDAHAPVALTTAAFDDEAVLGVAGVSGDTVTVEGVGDGGALLSVEGDTEAGEHLTDSINLLAATPEVLRLWHDCSDTSAAAYVQDATVWIPYDMEKTNGQSVIGYGYYPVETTGPLTLDPATSGQTWMVFTTGTPGAATVTSTIDDTALNAQVVAPAEVDGVEEPVAYVLEDIDVGDTNSFYVRPRAGGLTVCQADLEKAVVSDTPEICDVRDADAGDTNLHEYGWFEIEGIAAGSCLYTVTFPEGNDGAGASMQFAYTIQP